MTITTPDELFIHKLSDIYDAENQILKAMPKIVKEVENPELKKAFELHIEQTSVQVERLDQIFEIMDEKPMHLSCKGMEGIIAEAEEALKIKAEIPSLKDLAIISAARKVEHYEIAAYTSVILLAKSAELDEAEKLLSKTLKEEQETDLILSKLEQATA